VLQHPRRISVEDEFQWHARAISPRWAWAIDVYGRDATKAARRAVSDAIRHPKPQLCSLFGKTPQDMLVDVTIGVPNPNGVDTAVAKELPCGTVKVAAVKGGLEVGAGMKDFDDAQELLLQLSRRRINNVRLGHPAPGAFNNRSFRECPPNSAHETVIESQKPIGRLYIR